MMETRTLHRFSQAARKWRDLVDRRCAHFVELHSSGRWKLYYDEAEFVLRMREALDLATRRPPRPRTGQRKRAARRLESLRGRVRYAIGRPP
jgi:hypothetical protein